MGGILADSLLQDLVVKFFELRGVLTEVEIFTILLAASFLLVHHLELLKRLVQRHFLRLLHLVFVDHKLVQSWLRKLLLCLGVLIRVNVRAYGGSVGDVLFLLVLL